MNKNERAMYNALKVITLDPEIRRFLEWCDPNAFRQAEEALKPYDEKN